MTQERQSRQIRARSLLDNASSFLVSPRFLRERLLIYAVARFGVAGAIVAGAWFASTILGVEQLHVQGLYTLAACLGVYNVIVFLLLFKRSWSSSKAYRQLILVMHVTISLDFVFLTIALWLVGGAASPFASFYILHIILAGMLLSRLAMAFQALFGYLLFVGLVLGQSSGIVPFLAPTGAVMCNRIFDYRYAVTLLFVQAALFVLTAVFVSEMANALKRGERALNALNAELEELSAMRRDFLHVVAHNLKAPTAAATMMLSTIEQLWAADAPEKVRKALTRAKERVQDLGSLVQDLQRLSTLESGALREQEQSFNLNDMAGNLAEEYRDVAVNKGQDINVQLAQALPDVHVVPRLIHEAAVNYVTNAIKYTPEGGRIMLRTEFREGMVAFEVEDTGVGVPPEHIDRLFGEFIRAPARVDGQRPPGIGLGLSIVKRVVEHYGGHVYVSSKPGKGSIFGFALPPIPWAPVI